MIIRIGAEFLDATWNEDALVIRDSHHRVRCSLIFDTQHLPTKPDRLCFLLALVDTRIVCGGPPECINLDGSPAETSR